MCYPLAFEKPKTHLFDITIHAEGLDGNVGQLQYFRLTRR